MKKYVYKIVLFSLVLIAVSFAREAKRTDSVVNAGVQLVQGETIKKQTSNGDEDRDSLMRKRSHKRRKKSRGRRLGR